MSQIKSKFIKWGTGTTDVNSRSMPANFTPTTYIPTQVSSEGNDKVSAHLNGIDNIIGSIDTSIQNELNTGFVSWGGSGNYYSISSGSLNILRPGTGYVQNVPVSWTAPQISPVFSANTINYVYIDANGIIGSSTSVTSTLYSNNIVLFEVLYDGTNYVTVKENHPYSFSTSLSRYLHGSVGTIVQGSGAVITRVTTGTGGVATDREIKIVGEDIVADHGLYTSIPDTAGAAVAFNHYYTNSSGKWIRDSQQSELPMKFNSAGTPTTIGAGKFGAFRVYVSKDDLNSSNPTYYTVMSNAEYNNIGAARTAITNGIDSATNELAALEFAQLGYAIVQNSGGGFISELQIAKDVLRSITSSASVTNSAALVTTNTANFTKNLGPTDTTVQTALETLDQINLPIASSGDLNETSFGASNNVSVATNITSFVFSNSVVRSFIAQVSIIVNATSPLYAVYEIKGIQKSSSWEISQDYTGDSTGYTFSITSSGQLQYTNLNYSGFTSSVLKFRATTLSI